MKNIIKSTKAQREYLKSICRDLNIKYSGKLMDREEVEAFISKHKNEQRLYYIKNNKPFPPTNKQKKFIKAIEKNLVVTWKGETLEDAKSFIKKWSPKFYRNIDRTDRNEDDGELIMEDINEWWKDVKDFSFMGFGEKRF